MANSTLHFELLFITNYKRIKSLPEDLHGDVSLKEAVESVRTGQYEAVLQSALGQRLLGSRQEVAEDLDLCSHLLASVEQHFNNGDPASQQQNQLGLLCVGVSCLQLFVQNNWTGPPSEADPWQLLPEAYQHQDKRCSMDAYILDNLAVDGEAVYRLSKHPLFLLLAKVILMDCRKYLELCQTSSWWLMRLVQVQQSLLEERSPTLKQQVLGLVADICTKEPLATDDQNRAAMLQFHLEAGHLLYFYYEPSDSKEQFGKARKLAGVTIELTGAMGKRTKYQQKDLAQLSLKVERVSCDGDTNTSMSEDTEVDRPSSECLPKDLDLDDDTVLNEIKFTEDDGLLVKVSAVEQAFILAMCHEHRRSHEGVGDIMKEESLAYVTGVLSQRQNWSVLSTALLLRAYWESDSTRRLERSLAQLEELVSQLSRPSEDPAERLHLVYAVKLPPVWEVKRELGHFLVKIGVLNAALEVYLPLEMWEDVINCYKQLGRREKAENVIREQLAVSETPSMWCYLGDVTEDKQYYEKAWELSNGRYARAQRCLGLLYLRAGEFDQCAECLEKSLAINPLQIGVWFSYGCASMALEKYEQAAKAFRRCVIIDSDNFEAWSNLATSFIRCNQKAKAFVTMQEALKCDYENWRMWENYMLIGTDVGQFAEVIRAYHRLLDLKRKSTDTEVLRILVRAVNEDIDDAKGNPGSKHRKALLELFTRLSEEVTPEADMWKLYGELLTAGKVEPSASDRHRAMQYFQKSHRCVIQSPTWFKEADRCKEVLEQTSQLATLYLQVSEKCDDSTQAVQMLSSAKLSLKGVLTKVKQTHTDPISKQLLEDLVSPCNQLEGHLQSILDAIEDRKGS